MKCYYSRCCWFVLLILVLLHLESEWVAAANKHGTSNVNIKTRQYGGTLSFTYYENTCPDLETIVHQKMEAWIKQDFTLAPSIIRLHFHDCAVRGCDASILLNHAGSERRAYNSRTLRGFQVIDDIKVEVEKRCPRTVSCADLLTVAARDATVMAGGPFWEVPFGRKDGRISISREADMAPSGHENITTLINFFQARGLNVLDLVALSGSHTIGRCSCSSIRQRLFNYNQTGKPDPSMIIQYSSLLKKKCTKDYYLIDLDAMTPRTFDTMYYSNLGNQMGLLTTDQLLYLDARTAPYVDALASQPDLFMTQFAVSMVKLGNTQVLTGGRQGEIRLNCNYVNL
ncbi:peroxidase 7-like [Malania oleifera]|uniref:peroxidase 7-like n=1 Tax=Malania oleifera TaxID=397392 RepID=UPI0025ADF5ED|nr:peroxidase 7-like [Malania oleifera]